MSTIKVEVELSQEELLKAVKVSNNRVTWTAVAATSVAKTLAAVREPTIPAIGAAIAAAPSPALISSNPIS